MSSSNPKCQQVVVYRSSGKPFTLANAGLVNRVPVVVNDSVFGQGVYSLQLNVTGRGDLAWQNTLQIYPPGPPGPGPRGSMVWHLTVLEKAAVVHESPPISIPYVDLSATIMSFWLYSDLTGTIKIQDLSSQRTLFQGTQQLEQKYRDDLMNFYFTPSGASHSEAVFSSFDAEITLNAGVTDAALEFFPPAEGSANQQKIIITTEAQNLYQQLATRTPDGAESTINQRIWTN